MDTTLRLTKKLDFHMAHALEGYDGKCSHIHGHTYILEVTVMGQITKDGSMVMDFKSIKKIVQEHIVEKYDHSLILQKTEKSMEIYENLEKGWGNVYLMEKVPTTENLLLIIVEKIKSVLPAGIDLYSVKLCETDTSWAEWYASDNAR